MALPVHKMLISSNLSGGSSGKINIADYNILSSVVGSVAVLKLEAVFYAETLKNSSRHHCVTFQKTPIFIVTSINATKHRYIAF